MIVMTNFAGTLAFYNRLHASFWVAVNRAVDLAYYYEEYAKNREAVKRHRYYALSYTDRQNKRDHLITARIAQRRATSAMLKVKAILRGEPIGAAGA